jgi:hypothetical protein
VSDQKIGFLFDELRSSVGDDRALRDYGIESCRLQTESANRLLTRDPETVDSIKYMETVSD